MRGAVKREVNGAREVRNWARKAPHRRKSVGNVQMVWRSCGWVVCVCEHARAYAHGRQSALNAFPS